MKLPRTVMNSVKIVRVGSSLAVTERRGSRGGGGKREQGFALSRFDSIYRAMVSFHPPSISLSLSVDSENGMKRRSSAEDL